MFEENLIGLAEDHFGNRVSKEDLDIISEFGWGHENWFQNQLLIAFRSNGVEAQILSKKGKDADIVVVNEGEDIGIELRTTVKGRTPRLIKALEEHKDADLYMFFTEIRDRPKTKERLFGYLEEKEYQYVFRELEHSNWMLVLVKNG